MFNVLHTIELPSNNKNKCSFKVACARFQNVYKGNEREIVYQRRKLIKWQTSVFTLLIWKKSLSSSPMLKEVLHRYNFTFFIYLYSSLMSCLWFNGGHKISQCAQFFRIRSYLRVNRSSSHYVLVCWSALMAPIQPTVVSWWDFRISDFCKFSRPFTFLGC